MTDAPDNTGSGDGNANPQDRGETSTSSQLGTALIDGATFSNRLVHYSVIDGLAVVEGDIVLGTAEEVERETRLRRSATDDITTEGVGISGSRFRWPNGVVPYEVDPNLANPQRVTDAVAHWMANTPLRFVQRTAANQAQYPDFVRFVSGSGCSSQVGRRGGQQNVTLGANCTTGSTIHEIGHVIGLWHEQSREDRDSFVTINWTNIISGNEHNFNQHITDGDDIGGYDYGSIMHYSRTAFSRNGQDTIVPTQAGAQIGQRNGLSTGDISAALALYSPDPDGQWSTWFGLGGSQISAVSVVNDGSVTDIYVIGGDGTLYQKWWDGRRWNPGDADFHWHGDTKLQAGSLSVIGAPGFRDVYAMDQSGQLIHKFWTADGGWSQWFGLGGICSAVSVVRVDGVTDIYVRGQDGTLFQKWWDGQRWNPGDADFHWHGADFRMQPNSLSVIAAPGFRDLYAINLNGQLCHRYWTASGGWSQWFGLGGVCSAVAAVATGDKTDMYVRGQDGTLFQKWWDGRQHMPGPADFFWHGTGLRMRPKALSVIGWKGFRDVYALDPNGQLCHKYFA